MNLKTFAAPLILLGLSLTLTPILVNAQPSMNSTATKSQNQTTEVIIQNTSMSVPASVRHHGQPLHEIVWALPLRDDGKMVR